MADYSGTGRSNYVKFTDLEKVKRLSKLYNLSMHASGKDPDAFAFVAMNSDGEVSQYFDKSSDELIKELDELGIEADNHNELPEFLETIAKYLEKDYVFIWTHVGNEKAKYLAGYSYAINSKGEMASVSLDQISKKAEHLGKIITAPEY